MQHILDEHLESSFELVATFVWQNLDHVMSQPYPFHEQLEDIESHQLLPQHCLVNLVLIDEHQKSLVLHQILLPQYENEQPCYHHDREYKMMVLHKFHSLEREFRECHFVNESHFPWKSSLMLGDSDPTCLRNQYYRHDWFVRGTLPSCHD